METFPTNVSKTTEITPKKPLNIRFINPIGSKPIP